MTNAGDLLYYSGNRILFPPHNEICDSLTVVDRRLHSYIRIDRFHNNASAIATIASPACTAAVKSDHAPQTRPWSEIKRIIDEVHCHTCSHSNYSDRQTLLKKQLWSKEAQEHLSDTLQRCKHSIAASTPQPRRKLVLTTLNRPFKELLLVDHFHSSTLRQFHILDSYSWF